MSIKKIILTFLCIIVLGQMAYSDETIQAQKNAYRHNNKGLLYLQDKYYFGAIKEFEIAIDLLPNTQATASFYTNLGNTYEKIGHPDLAKPCFEKAVSLNVLCFDYYLRLAENYSKLGIVEQKIEEFQNKPFSPLNDIMIGLLLIQKGDVSIGITMLDIFCEKEPNLLITTGVKQYLEKITKEKLQ